MAKSLISDNTSVVTFSILVEGQQIPLTYGVVSIQVTSEINKIPYAKIKLIDGGVGESEGFEIGNSADFAPGKKITIKAGYESDEEEIFKGIVVKHGISVDINGAFLHVECKHEAVKMTIGRKNDLFNEKKDSEIINSIIQKYSIQKEVDTTETAHPEVVQHYVSDWDFVLMRADINGLVVKPDLDKLVIKAPDFSAEPDYDVVYGSTLISFDADIDARAQLKTVEGFSWDYSNQEIINAKGNSTGDHHAGNFTSSDLAKVIGLESYLIQTPAYTPIPVLDTMTTAKLTKAQLGFMKGSAKIRGVADVKPGDWLNISGLSDRFNGKMYVGGVNHQINNQGWITECFIGISDDWYVNETPGIDAPPASGFIPPFKGLTTAVVKQIHEDPDGNYRVLIAIPTLQKDNMKLWARLSNLYATNESGTFFFPEINDEVIVGFLNEDPQNPVILGMLYSKTNKAPLEPADKNPEKAIITKEKLTISFNDEKKIITIHTPGENSITIDDDAQKIIILDQHKNNIEMSDTGISLTSDQEIKVTAKGDITIESQGNINLKATADLNAEGMNASIKGQSQFTAEGAMTEVKGSGQTTIKGGMVMIN